MSKPLFHCDQCKADPPLITTTLSGIPELLCLSCFKTRNPSEEQLKNVLIDIRRGVK